MPMICTLSPYGPPEVSVFTRGSSECALAPVGYDDFTGTYFSVLVSLDPIAGGSPDERELTFVVLELDEDENEVGCYWSGLETVGKIYSEDRGYVLLAVLHALGILLMDFTPRRVEYFTWDENLPRKAEVKYSHVAQVLKTCGYVVQTADPYHGRRAWWAERLPGEPISNDVGGSDENEPRSTD